MSRRSRPSLSRCWMVLPCLAALFQTGCTSAITTAYLRDAWLDGGDHAEESAAIAADSAKDSAQDEPEDAGDSAASTAARRGDPSEVDSSRRAAAIEEAVARLSKLGTLDDAARATLIDTLRRTQQEDWPVVIEAFAETLASAAAPGVTTPHVVAKEPTEKPATATADIGAAAAVVASASPAVIDEATRDAGATAVPPEPPQSAAEATSGPPAAPAATSPAAAAVARPTLGVQNATFATRVRAWGDFDRFSASRFRPGQEVIVYFELENLSAGESPTGHTTCIDTVIKLVGPTGQTVHEWSFEPIAETLKARRRDYFARYVVRMPEECPPGGCRLELNVTDTLAGATAEATLPFELAAE